MNPEGKTLLVVDDDREIREVMQLVLSSEGYHVHLAANGQDALELLKFGLKPAAIVLDLMMPVLNGLEFLEVLRKEPQYRHPVVVMSANQGFAAEELGVQAVVRKPAAIETLLAALERAFVAPAFEG